MEGIALSQGRPYCLLSFVAGSNSTSFPGSQLSFSAKLGVVLTCAVLLTSCSDGTTRTVSSTILAARGGVRAKNGHTEEFLPARPGFTLRAGAVVQSAEGSLVDLLLLSNTPHAPAWRRRANLDSVRLSKDGNETADPMIARHVEISLPKGTVFMRYRQPAGSVGALLVTTPHGTITANSDCLVCLEVNSRRLRVICIRGVVESVPAGSRKSLAIDAGSVAELTSRTSSLTEVAQDAEAGEKVTEALSAEGELLKLARAQRNLLPR